MSLYRESGLDASLQQKMVVDGKQYCLYADAAYILRVYLQIVFPRARATATQRVYGALLSAVREAVEWTYNDHKQMCSSKYFKRKLKIRTCPISPLYKAAELLWNVKTCLHKGGKWQHTSTAFPQPLSAIFPPQLDVKLVFSELKMVCFP